LAKLNLTARRVAALKPKPTRVYYFDLNLPGFCVGVTPKGVKSFSVVYRHVGRLRRLTIGTTDRWSLADARDAAREALRLVDKGQDPAAKKRQQHRAEIKTFADLAKAFMERYSKKKKRSWREDQRIIDANLLPAFKHSGVPDLTRSDVRLMLEGLGERVIANRVLACMRKIYNWGISQDLVENNPCSQIPRPATERSRDKVLTEAELKAIWKAFDEEPPLMEAMYKLRLITAQRGGEIASMRWADITKEGEDTWWTIPAESSKNKKPHRVPLSSAAVGILDGLRRKQSKLKNPRKRKSPFVFYAPRGGGHIGELQKSAQRIRENATKDLKVQTKDGTYVMNFRAHDLRRTAASYMTSMGISRLVVGRILNHAEPGVTAVYDRHSYDREKREALNQWLERLTAIVSPDPLD
jgi:integrase